MKVSKLVSIGFLVALLACGALAQTRRRPPLRPVKPAEQPTLTPQPLNQPRPSRAPRAPISVAIVNGQTITTADIDPQVRDAVESLDDRIADVRRQILDIQINTMLLDHEANKRGLTPQQLFDVEVKKRIGTPTEAEIQRFIQENRNQLNQTDEAALRADVIAYLRSTEEAKGSAELARRLRGVYPVGMGVDVNSPNFNESAVVATVAGKPITGDLILERLKPAIYKLRLETYELEKEAVEQTIYDMLLIAEANRRNVAPEQLVRTEISDKVRVPTEAEVTKFYTDNKASITGDLNSVRNQVANYLHEQERRRLEQAMSARLRQGADVRLLFSEPQRPVQKVSVDDDPSRGDANAPVTVIEFTDFQCSACAAMHPILEEVLKSYGNKVRFVVRDFPLPIHANARKAAEAANAAHAQGKFFEYTALLYKRQNALDVPSLKKYASEIGLDRARFDAALDKGTYAAEVRRDIKDGEIYGIESTPTIFVNGIALTALSSEGLRAAIDKALAAVTSKGTVN